MGAIINFPCLQQYISNTIMARWKETWSGSLQLPGLDWPSLGSGVWPLQLAETRCLAGLLSQGCSEVAETRCPAGPQTEWGRLPSPMFLLSFWLQIQPTQRCWSFEAQGTCNNRALYCLQESGSRGLAAGWRCVAGQLPVSFALFQLSEFSLVFMASIAVVQTIYIALHLFIWPRLK